MARSAAIGREAPSAPCLLPGKGGGKKEDVHFNFVEHEGCCWCERKGEKRREGEKARFRRRFAVHCSRRSRTVERRESDGTSGQRPAGVVKRLLMGLYTVCFFDFFDLFCSSASSTDAIQALCGARPWCWCHTEAQKHRGKAQRHRGTEAQGFGYVRLQTCKHGIQYIQHYPVLIITL